MAAFFIGGGEGGWGVGAWGPFFHLGELLGPLFMKF